MEVFVPPTCFISSCLILCTCALFGVRTRKRAPEVPNAKQTRETAVRGQICVMSPMNYYSACLLAAVELWKLGLCTGLSSIIVF